jgi:hypothetical protein
VIRLIKKWETSIDPAYVPAIPEELHGEFQTQ